jgi:hypothetical protein
MHWGGWVVQPDTDAVVDGRKAGVRGSVGVQLQSFEDEFDLPDENERII